jgi:C_GCAxxG_C_C family probable redox protein
MESEIINFRHRGYAGDEMMKTDVAVDKFLSGYNCAQSVLYSFCDEFGLDRTVALKLACGFGAGMGRNQEICGAVSGGIMVIGLKYGRGEKDDTAANELTYRKTRELMQQFKQHQGSFICRELLGGCDLMTTEGQKDFKDRDLKNRTCKVCVQTTVLIVEDLLKDISVTG